MICAGGLKRTAAIVSLGLLVACGGTAPTSFQSPAPVPDEVPEASPEHRANQAYYARYVDQQRARGLMRTDGGGPDTPFDMRDILNNFERLAFYDEYARDGSFTAAGPTEATLARWEGPVRFSLHFGDSLARADQRRLSTEIATFATRLERITRHPIAVTGHSGNFDVVVMGHDDATQLDNFLTLRRPVVGQSPQRVLRTMPRDVHCIVMAFSNAPDGAYSHAIAYIRAEAPPALMTACIHEELAQGLGLANDSPYARPSIFNDDDEFATLTAMDEVMLQILYDARLRSGMNLQQARPILRRIGDDLNRPNS